MIFCGRDKQARRPIAHTLDAHQGISCHPGHIEVDDEGIERRLFKDREGLARVRGGRDFVSVCLEELANGSDRVRLVVSYEKARH